MLRHTVAWLRRRRGGERRLGGQRSSGCGSCRFRSLEMAQTPRYLGRQEAAGLSERGVIVTDQPGEREDHADRKHTDDGRRERSGTSTEEEPRTEPRVETDNGDRKQSGTSTEEEPPTEPRVETDNGDRKQSGTSTEEEPPTEPRVETDNGDRKQSGTSTEEEPPTEPRVETDNGGREQSGTSTEEEPPTEPTVETDKGRAAASEASGDSEHPQRETAGGADPRDRDDEEERRKSAEEFAREHDPANHDFSAGEESRQKGDWTADEAGGPQVWDADGNLVEGATPGEPRRSHEQSDRDNSDVDADSRRTSALEEVRDGGYGGCRRRHHRCRGLTARDCVAARRVLPLPR